MYDSPVTSWYYGTNAAGACGYTGPTSGILVSPAVTGITSNTVLRFRMRRGTWNVTDHTYVAVSTNAAGTPRTNLAATLSTDPANWNSSNDISLAAYAGQTIYIVFDFNATSTAAGKFGWMIDDVEVARPMSCDAAVPIDCTTATAVYPTGATNEATVYAACSGNTYAGNEAMFLFTLAVQKHVTFTITPSRPGQNLDAFLITACDPTTCASGGGDVISTPFMAPANYYLLVDGLTQADNGNFQLAVNCGDIHDAPIACGQNVSANTASGNARIDQYTCTGVTDYRGNELVYLLTNPVAQNIYASVDSPNLDVILSPASDVLACNGFGDTLVPWYNAPAQSYYVIVDGPAGEISEPFNLTVSCSLPDCASRVIGDISCPGAWTGTTIGGRNSNPVYGCTGQQQYPGPEAVYRFNNTVQQDYSLWLTQNYDLLDLFVLDANCNQGSCVGSGDRMVNLTNLPVGVYYVVVDGADPAGADYAIELHCAMALDCANRVIADVSCPNTYSGTTVGGNNNMILYGCTKLVEYWGAEAVYRFVNPVQQAVTFSLTRNSNLLDIFLFNSACNEKNCLAFGDSRVCVDNLPPGTYYIVLDGTDAAGADYDLQVRCLGACSQLIDCSAPLGTLQCGSRVQGDTSIGVDNVELYNCSDKHYGGPEVVYVLTNAVQQQVDIALMNATPGLSVFLLDACDAARCVDSFGDAVVVPDLAPGSYYVVVDGENGARGPFELMVFCGAPRLEPASIELWMSPGDCMDEAKTVTFPTHVSAGDVMFSIDCTGSMEAEIAQVRTNIADIVSRLSLTIDDLQFGLATFNEYDRIIMDTVCHVGGGNFGATPFKLNLPLTSDLNAMQTALNGVTIMGGGTESYTRTFYEAYANPNIGWRECARKIWVNLGDELPQDCNVAECMGGFRNTGRDPGPDRVTGTADDLLLLPVLDAMTAADIIMIHVDSSEIVGNQDIWSCLAERTGGSVLKTDANGNIPGGVDFASAIARPVRSAVRACDNLTLSPTPGYENWLASVTPSSYTGVKTPFSVDFTIRLCVPAGTPTGDYTFQVMAACVGQCLESPEMAQTVLVHVSQCEAAAVAPSPVAICVGESVTLDGSASNLQFCNGTAEYRWLDGATVVRDWSSDPTVVVTPAATTTYTLEVRCSTESECSSSDDTLVDVFPYPTAFAGNDLKYCHEDFIDLTAGGSSSTKCSVPLEYRWRKGALVLRDWSTDPTFRVQPPEEADFQVDVRCPEKPECVSTDEVKLIKDCPMAVSYGSYGAKVSGEGVTVYWNTLTEVDTLGFWVERTENPSEPAGTLQLGPVPALGPGNSYELVDRDAKQNPGRFQYRVVELTAQGSGDKTPFFKVQTPGKLRPVDRGRSGAGSGIDGGSPRRAR
jgi:hypothetical protein